MNWPNEHCEPLLHKAEKRLQSRGIDKDDIDDIMQDVRIHVFKNAKPDAGYFEMNRWVFLVTNFRIQKTFDANRKHRDLPLPTHDTPIEVDGRVMDLSDKGKLENQIIDSVYVDAILSEMPESDATIYQMVASGETFIGAVKQAGGHGKDAVLKRRTKVREKYEPR